MVRRSGILVVAFVAAACTRSTDTAVAPAAVVVEVQRSSRAPLYSPWVLDVEDPAASFESISFKDVGLMSVAPADRAIVHHEIAEALSSELGGDAPMSLSTHVRYDLAMSLPETHLACTGGHIYVDLWDGSNPERIGYSLWSGCSEEGRFAWQEVLSEAAPDRRTAIHTLARSIAGSIKKARQTRCFTRSC